jgi:uncharacterized protein (TIGR02246 family)
MANLQGDLERAAFVDQKFLQDEEAAVKRITNEWAHAINSGEPLKVAALYDNPFILYATFTTKIDTAEALVDYFTKLMTKKNFKVEFNEQNPRAHGATALDSGLYTFSFTDEAGKRVEVAARYTFVYALTPNGWRIVDHHSSELPI